MTQPIPLIGVIMAGSGIPGFVGSTIPSTGGCGTSVGWCPPPLGVAETSTTSAEFACRNRSGIGREPGGQVPKGEA